MAEIVARYEIRAAIKAALAHPTLGFNSIVAGLCASLSVPSYSIDFIPGSTNFIEAHITPESDSDERRAIERFPAIILYTSAAQFTGRTKNTRFSGQIVGHVDLYLSFRERDGNDWIIDAVGAEDLADASEEALLRSIDLLSARNGTSILPTPIVYGIQGLAVERSPIRFYGDGYKQLIQVLIPFEVTQ